MPRARRRTATACPRGDRTPRPPSSTGELLELVAESIAKIEQVLGVLCRVLEHARGEWPHGPIGALVLLVELYAEEPFEQRGEPERPNTEELGRDPRVEDIRDLPAVVLVKEPQVVVSVVEDDFHLTRFEKATEALGNADRERIENRAGFARRELEQVDPVDEPVEARALGVERDGSSVRNAWR